MPLLTSDRLVHFIWFPCTKANLGTMRCGNRYTTAAWHLDATSRTLRSGGSRKVITCLYCVTGRRHYEY